MSSARSSALGSLLALREADERRAEQAFADAVSARARAEAAAERLAQAEARARTELARRRGEVPAGERAADALGRRRFLERLAAEVASCASAVERARRDEVDPARRAEETARGAHLRARQRREVVGRALERRAAAAKIERERREEAAADDRGRGARSVKR